jgi:alpha-galactosidase
VEDAVSAPNPRTVQVGTAAAAIDSGTVRIGNDLVGLTLAAPAGGTLRATRLTGPGGPAWDLVGDAPPFALAADGNDLAAETAVARCRVENDGDAVRARITLAVPGGTELDYVVECVDGQGVLRQWLEVRPGTSLTLRRIEPVRLALAAGELSEAYTVSGVQRQGGWRDETGWYRPFRLESQSLAEPVLRHSGPRSTWDETPWVALTGEDDGGVMLALEYGGRWSTEVAPERDSVVAAMSVDGITTTLAPGAAWTSPPGWVGAFPGDLDSAAATMRRFVRDTVVPATSDDFPWVQYNTWFSYFCELDHDTLLREADIAADIGVEVFYVDAGWWAGNPMRRDRFSSGLGNWTENREKFPDGLRAFADEIRARAMHFGIWVEPERVDLRTATTGTWRPEWIAREESGGYVRCDWPSDTETAWLCFGHPETQEWATRWIGDMVEALGVRWLKWDSNYWGVCTSADHGHGTGDGERAQLEGVYEVMRRLRERHPDLIIENCAGGATRLDFAISRQTHAAWLNDASEPTHRSRFHNAGASYLFPLTMLNAWVTESEHENVNGQTLPDPVWRSVIRSRMLGAIGFSCRLPTWSDATREVAREEVARYKTEIRPLLRDGDLYHLLPQPSIPSHDLPTPDVWEAYQLAAADGSRHVVLGFRNVSPDDAITLPLRVDPEATYRVSAEGGEARSMAGSLLADSGLTLACPLLASTWVTLEREGAE